MTTTDHDPTGQAKATPVRSRGRRGQPSGVAHVLALVVAVLLSATVWAPAGASSHDHPDDHDHQLHHRHHPGPYFGEHNFPPGCTRDMSRDNPDNICFRMKDLTYLNPVGSPQIDVLILVPASPTAERDMRIMRQAVEMWEGGIAYLARQMGLDWLAEGVAFHITVDAVDLTGDQGGQFTTYPLVDPEIVVIGANPVGGAGIGISPGQVPCHGLGNPFDFEYWEHLPGFSSHHDSRGGTYVEDCGGSGGNVCFAVTAGLDPDPTTIDMWSMFNIIAHEFGHCLALGHVGDGGEEVVAGAGWGPVPLPELMSYSDDIRMWVVGESDFRTKCVSTLNVEVFATRMSHYLDTNGDGEVGPVLTPNDLIGADDTPFQVQHPADHLYASSTGSPLDCPQPDLGLLPGPRTNWTPEPVPAHAAVLEVTAPAAGTVISGSRVEVTGTVRHRPVWEPVTPPPTSVTVDDDPADATGPFTEIESVTVTATDTHVEAVIQLDQIWPSLQVRSPVVYSLTIDGRRFDSYVDRPVPCPTCTAAPDSPRTFDGWRILPEGTSAWDLEHDRVLFHIPREYLRHLGITAPHAVSVSATHGTHLAAIPDDWAPEPGGTVSLGAPPQLLPSPVEHSVEDGDRDGDGVPDELDRCPDQPGLMDGGCTALRPTQIRVYVDGVLAGAQDVHADYDPDDFAIPLDELPPGNHIIRVEWLDDGLLATDEFTVTGNACHPPRHRQGHRCPPGHDRPRR